MWIGRQICEAHARLAFPLTSGRYTSQKFLFLLTYCFFLVKDRGMMGQGMFLGEAFIPLQEIQVLYSDTQNIVE